MDGEPPPDDRRNGKERRTNLERRDPRRPILRAPGRSDRRTPFRRRARDRRRTNAADQTGKTDTRS